MIKRRLFPVLVLLLILGLTSCGKSSESNNSTSNEKVDYVAQTKLTTNFDGKTFITDGIEEVKLEFAVDGDTTHFTAKNGSLIKIRYCGIDTPESTGDVEPWGRKASAYNKSKILNASSIVIESEDGGPAVLDSTSARYMGWVWYKQDGDTDYKLLNLEMMQEGYAKSKNSGSTKYGSVFILAANQALKLKINLWSGKDPDYCYGNGVELTLKTLINNKDKYVEENAKVAFEANITRVEPDGLTVYAEDIDGETGVTYGIQLYKGYNLHTKKLVVGNRVRIWGSPGYFNDTFQISGMQDIALSSSPNNLKVIEEGIEIVPKNVTISDINDGLLFTLVTLKDLKVKSTYTTESETSSNGAISIKVESNGVEFTIRTSPMYDISKTYIVDNNNLILEDNYTNKTLKSVTGIIDKYDGKFQLKLLSMDDVVFD